MVIIRKGVFVRVLVAEIVLALVLLACGVSGDGGASHRGRGFGVLVPVLG